MAEKQAVVGFVFPGPSGPPEAWIVVREGWRVIRREVDGFIHVAQDKGGQAPSWNMSLATTIPARHGGGRDRGHQ